MGNELEFFPFFVEQFRTATLSWPAERVGAYWLCLMYQWEHGYVPGDDLEELALVMHEPIANARKIWVKISVKFPKGDHGYQNRKLEEVRKGVLSRVEKGKHQTKNATVAAAEARRSMKRNRHGTVTDSVTAPPTETNLESTETDQKTIPTPTPPLQGGAPSSSVMDDLTERAPTRQERAKAQGILDQFGCPHEHPEADPPVPACETTEFCIGRLVGEMRAEERKGLKVGVA